MTGKGVFLEVLESRREAMTDREREFADGILAFHQYQGYLTEKQLSGARKLATRLICERDGK